MGRFTFRETNYGKWKWNFLMAYWFMPVRSGILYFCLSAGQGIFFSPIENYLAIFPRIKWYGPVVPIKPIVVIHLPITPRTMSLCLVACSQHMKNTNTSGTGLFG
jgi:hypothetical protein